MPDSSDVTGLFCDLLCVMLVAYCIKTAHIFAAVAIIFPKRKAAQQMWVDLSRERRDFDENL